MTKVEQAFSSFQFIQNRLVDLKFTNNRLKTDMINLKKNFDINYKIESIEEREDHYIGVITLHISLTAKDDLGKAFSIKLIMEAYFTNNKSQPIEKFENMLRLNGVSTLYSICRAYLTTISSISFIGDSIKLPMLNVLMFKELKDQDSKDTKKQRTFL